MRFLADECCDSSAVQALRDRGYDVLAVGSSSNGDPMTRAYELAFAQHRILLTKDKDFGWLTFVARMK